MLGCVSMVGALLDLSQLKTFAHFFSSGFLTTEALLCLLIQQRHLQEFPQILH
jgi:hypothetical protein